jgi:Secretion system C-terminal sorting domain/IPT/TIG domain
MKKITCINFVLILLFYLSSFENLSAQVGLVEISLQKQIEASSLVVEGKVISKQSFWDVNHHNIYTTNTVEVYKVFKGVRLETIEVITPGGTVGLNAESVSPSLKLRKGDIGVFMLHDNNIAFAAKDESANKRFKPYSSVQGFYKYNITTNIAANPFTVRQGVSDSFYNEIRSFTKLNYIEVSQFDIKKKNIKSKQKKNAAHAITSFLPTTSTAGTASVLTITGTGFGAVQGKVGFSDADDGGATFIDALDTQVLTWTDTEITVEIPSGAGTGTIRVTHDDASTTVSAGVLTITYAQLNVEGDFGFGVLAYPVQHVDDNTTGGYTWEMFTDFDTDTEVPGAKASFLRALETWRCTTKVNWIVGSVSAIDVIAGDGTNIVRFDNGTELGAGVLGRCTSRYTGCGIPGGVEWYVEELDIVFDDGVTWETGPPLATTGEIDFESVALHELGHGHQLGHVIEGTGAVMHFALSSAENIRTLTAGDIAGAGDVHSRSTTLTPCGTTSMTDYDTSGCALSVSENELSSVITVFPNPANGEFYISNSSFINLEKVIIYDISGRLISTHDISDGLNIKTIPLNNVSRGMYFVSIYSENAVITKKIILE